MNRTIELLNEVLKSYKGVAIAEMFSLGNGEAYGRRQTLQI